MQRRETNWASLWSWVRPSRFRRSIARSRSVIEPSQGRHHNRLYRYVPDQAHPEPPHAALFRTFATLAIEGPLLSEDEAIEDVARTAPATLEHADMSQLAATVDQQDELLDGLERSILMQRDRSLIRNQLDELATSLRSILQGPRNKGLLDCFLVTELPSVPISILALSQHRFVRVYAQEAGDDEHRFSGQGDAAHSSRVRAALAARSLTRCMAASSSSAVPSLRLAISLA